MSKFFYKFSKFLLQFLAYLIVVLLAIATGIVAGKGHFDFNDKGLLPWCIVFIISICLLGINMFFSFFRPVRKFSNIIFTIIGFLAVTLLGVISGWLFFGKQGGSFDGTSWVTSSGYAISAKVSGGLFTASCIVLGLFIFGGIGYGIAAKRQEH